MNGFIDPDAGRDRRIDRLEALVDLLLPTISLDVLSPEVRAVVEDLTSGDRDRVARGRAAYRRSYIEGDRARRATPQTEGDRDR